MSNPSKHTDSPAGLWYGVGGLALFALVAVLLRGIRWDEGYEHAQVLAGQVVYPPGHPLPYYLQSAFSLQTHSLAGLMALGAGPVMINGLRNVLFLLATLLPPYLFAAHLTGRTMWGVAAALILLQGSYLEFDGSYPLAVWPQLYSNGPIGGGFALLTLYLALAGHGRAAALCFGLMPAIHLGQFPPLLALAPLGLWEYRRYTRAGAVTHPYDWLAVGLGVSGLLWAWLHFRTNNTVLATTGTPEEIDAIWRAFTFHFDPHRRIPDANGQLLAVGTLVLGALLSLRHGTTRAHRLVNGLTLYTAIIAAVVWGTMTLQLWLGEALPRIFIVWMPYRLLNHLPPIALVLSLYALYRWRPNTAAVVVGGALLFGIAQPGLAQVLPTALNLRYITGGEAVAFGLWGAAMVAAVAALTPRRSAGPAVVLLCAVLVAGVHLFGAACIVAGAAAAWLAAYGDRVKADAASPGAMRWVAALTLVLAVTLTVHQYRYRTWLPTQEADDHIAALPVSRSTPPALLAPPDAILLQARTGRPVLFDATTFSLISYVPELGPTILRMHHSLYGYDPLGIVGAADGDWRAVWRARDYAAWKNLSKRYAFGIVLAPAALPLRIPHHTDAGPTTVFRME